MAADNHTTIVGNLVEDPEVRSPTPASPWPVEEHTRTAEPHPPERGGQEAGAALDLRAAGPASARSPRCWHQR